MAGEVGDPRRNTPMRWQPVLALGRPRTVLTAAFAVAFLAFTIAAVGQPVVVDDGAEASSPGVVAPFARYVVVVDLRENLLHFRYGDLTLWTAPVGTGTGLRLESESGEWDFSTPTGSYQVQFKERDPVWIAPDWYFVENGLPVPPRNHPSRYFPGGLGAAAVYFHPSLAIHGTNRTDLLGRRVSHGCIRLSNPFALRLFHNVQAGTEVVILGDDAAVATVGGDRPQFSPTDAAAPDEEDGARRGLSTTSLLAALDEAIRGSPGGSVWVMLAVELLARVDADDAALAGIFARADAFRSNSAAHFEWLTFLAEAYRRAPRRSLEIIAALPPGERETTAAALVATSMALYAGDWNEPGAPWPTRRIPVALLEGAAREGWNAVAAAERVFLASAPATVR